MFVFTFLSIALSLGMAYSSLRLDTDWLVLFNDDRPEITTLRYWRSHLPGSKDMAVIISGGDLQERKQAATVLGEAFEKEKELLESPLAAISTDQFVESGLYFLAPEQLRRLDQDTELALKGSKYLDYEREPELGYVTESMAQTLAGSELLARGLEAFVTATTPFSKVDPGEELIPPLAPESSELGKYLGDFQNVPSQAFLSLDGGRTLLVLVRPRIGNQALEAAGPAVERVRKLVTRVRADYPSLSLSFTGEPVLVVDERKTISRDSIRGTVCSLILVVLLFHFGFREFLRPALALVTLAVGLLWTLGVISGTIGHLNFITVTYVPILVGIGLDFGIHMAFRYYEHRALESPLHSVQHALEGAGKDTFYGALTTSAAFAVLWLIGFRGVSELGSIALCGVLLCQVSSCTFLPACLAWLEQRGQSLPVGGRQELSQVESELIKLDQPLLIGTVIALMASLILAPKVGFNVHLLKMQNPNLESVQTELRLVAEGKSSVLTALVSAPDIETARRLESELRAQPTVAEVISLATFLPRVSSEKERSVDRLLERREALLKLLDYLRDTPPAPTKEALKIMKQFESLKLPKPRLQAVRGLLEHLSERLSQRGPGPVMDAFEGLREETLTNLNRFEPLLRKQRAKPLQPDELPENLTGRLVLLDGNYVLKVFPRVDIWKPENLHQFLEEVRAVAPAVSGEPVLIELFERLVLRTHWWGMALSLLAMLVVLAAILKNIRDILMAALPTGLSLLLAMGLMGLLGWDFNPANFVAVPMLLGIGSVFGLHSVIRMKELGHERLLSCSTGPAIVLSAATSMAGFASLGLADHRGIASLGWLVASGLFFNAVLSIAVLPAWRRLGGKRWGS